MFLTRFYRQPTAPGIVLIVSGIIALLMSNSSLAPLYSKIIHTEKPANILFIINDVFMTLFFFIVGLEIKEQITTGHLSKLKQIILPSLAACGGVLIPALIFLAFNHKDEIARIGWAIPTATDIAFALGVILLLGNRIPPVLHVLLLAIAIVDDLIAIAIIAIFYSNNISRLYLTLGIGCFSVLYIINIAQKHKFTYYIFVGVLLWICMYKAGIHPAISGVFVALTKPPQMRERSHKILLPWVNFLILPLFAFANAGVAIDNTSLHELMNPVTLGISLGLILGKQLGIFGFAWLGIKIKIAALPKEISLTAFYGMAILCGIGFTMSVFISNLAYGSVSADYNNFSKIGILLGSTISALLGYGFLRVYSKRQ